MLTARIPSGAQPAISIGSCTKIGKAGLYEVDAISGLSSPSGNCIVIAASNVIVYLNGFPLTGSGSGAGVHILPSASNAFVEGRNAVISGFAVGIQIDGAKDLAENFTASNNTDAGVLLNNAKQAKLSNFTATSNSNDGLRIYKGSYNIATGSLDIRINGRYGIWLLDTSHDSVGGFDAADNPVAGVYIGCSSTGPIAAHCSPSIPPSKYNSIFDGTVMANEINSQQYGVVIDLGDDYNRITNISSFTAFEIGGDLVDENPNCANNDWFGHGIIYQPTQSCIH
jgi:hypothetical protein